MAQSNSLSLNIDKTYFHPFHTKTNQKYDFQTSYENRQITKDQNIKFLGIIIYLHLSWKQHIDDRIPKLNKAYFAIRSVKPFMSLEGMRLIYFSYFRYVLSYEIIFWGNSVHSMYSIKIQKRTIRIITNAGIIYSFRDLFKKLQILHFYTQHIYFLLKFLVKNRDLFKLISVIHGFSKRYDYNFHLPSAKLKLFHKGVFHSGIETYNHLPKSIKEPSHDVKQLRLAMKKFIIIKFLLFFGRVFWH